MQTTTPAEIIVDSEIAALADARRALKNLISRLAPLVGGQGYTSWDDYQLGELKGLAYMAESNLFDVMNHARHGLGVEITDDDLFAR